MRQSHEITRKNKSVIARARAREQARASAWEQ